MLPTLLCIVALVAGIAGVVMSPKAWQRAVALLVISIIVLFITQAGIVAGKKGLMAWHYGQNIRPTEQLWSMVSKEIEVGEYEQAKATLMIITTNWSRIGSWPSSYSAADILKDIEETQAANNTSEGIRQPADGSPKPSM